MTADDPRYLHCPLCGFEFEPEDTLCHHGCPLHTLCDLTRCPSCSYEFPAGRRPQPKRSFWARLLAGRSNPEPAAALADVLTLGQLEGGERAEIVGLACANPTRSNTLTVFGLAPGSEVTLLQRRPTYVIRVGETELAFDRDVAREILVKRVA